MAEAAQVLLRAVGQEDAYELLKQRTRGRVLTQEEYHTWCKTIDVDETTRQRLLALSPETCLGLAVRLTEQACQE